jgi:hypothetical protein
VLRCYEYEGGIQRIGKKQEGCMGAVCRFEELRAWQKARVLTRRVYDVTRRGEFGKDYGLAR